jgi:type VI secretion system secreted protein Hcp
VNRLRNKKQKEVLVMKKNGFISILLGIFILAFAVLAPVFADAAEDMMFVRIDGIQGESTDDRHKDWIDAFGFGNSILMTLPVAGGSGRSEFGPVKFLKSIDKASPKLLETVASGKHIREVEIEFYRSGGSLAIPYFKLRLADVLITEVSMTTGGELIALSFSKIRWEYEIIKPDGSSGGVVTGEWDLVLNKGT